MSDCKTYFLGNDKLGFSCGGKVVVERMTGKK
jgi:hypothetical protein